MKLNPYHAFFRFTPWPSSSVSGTGTANEITYWVNATTVGSLTTVTYPSLTELSYVKGVTSAIQTQFGLKANIASPTFTGTVTIPTPFTLGAVSVTTTGTILNFLTSAAGTTGTTSTNIVFSTSPTLITPALGTPSALVLTNATGLPAASVLAGSFGAGAFVISTSLQAATIELGHATDTTIARVSAGVISVEGNTIYAATGTDVVVADGGTGVSSLTTYAVICGGTTSTGAVQSIAGVGTSGQVLTSNGAGVLPSFQAAGGAGALTRAGGNSTEATTTSTTVVDLLTVSSLSITTGTPFRAMCMMYKSTGAANASRWGFTVNSTVVRNVVTWSDANNQTDSAILIIDGIGAQTNYKGSIAFRYAEFNLGAQSAVSGANTEMPIATITSLIFRALSIDALITTGMDEAQVYTYSTS